MRLTRDVDRKLDQIHFSGCNFQTEGGGPVKSNQLNLYKSNFSLGIRGFSLQHKNYQTPILQ